MLVCTNFFKYNVCMYVCVYLELLGEEGYVEFRAGDAYIYIFLYTFLFMNILIYLCTYVYVNTLNHWEKRGM
jgi:hypothetical protein